ncbi:hypothetical protein F53441_4531 [Fusarium austroafricanum]|uniref:Heterokaryon incompatibility domain-containing protein n=1 Tax=Fusarium austroafricanum TaxID=2364996 RepID=A0A8H4KN03_9HYPO|nr:hypothetical protein F53441_4531 [Fusarium austroafricanum]
MHRLLKFPLLSLTPRLFSRSISQASSSRLYKPLNPKTSEIRLLKIPPNPSSEFELVTVSLDDKPKYAALSYLWGDPQNYGAVTIEGNTVRIPDNLASAFLYILSDEAFRSQQHVKYIWADAICINQKDLDERSQQVKLMRPNLQTTDDRDYIYGLLGVSGIPITPNYAPENTTSHVYTKYITGWLKAACAQQTGHVHSPLAFLAFAGTGKFGRSDLPSWVPNFAEKQEMSTPWCYSTSDFRSADEGTPGLFLKDSEVYPYTVEETQSLFTWGIDMGTDLIDNAMNLAMVITYFNMDKTQSVRKTWDSNWDNDILRMAFPTTNLVQFGLTPNILKELSSWDLERRRVAVSSIMPVLYSYQFFETSRGDLGAADYELAEGDRLVVLRL